MRLLSSSLLEMMICSPLTLRTRVVLSPMRSTVPCNLIDGDRVADVERLVEDDRERREKIPKDVLHRERDRDTADPKSGDEGRDIDAEFVERGDEDDRSRAPAWRRCRARASS